MSLMAVVEELHAVLYTQDDRVFWYHASFPDFTQPVRILTTLRFRVTSLYTTTFSANLASVS